MKADNRNIFAIKAFLREYLDLRKDKDNELATVDSTVSYTHLRASTLSARELRLMGLMSGF